MGPLLSKSLRLLTLGHLLIIRFLCQMGMMSKIAKYSQLYRRHILR
jgi:hypothetical protein